MFLTVASVYATNQGIHHVTQSNSVNGATATEVLIGGQFIELGISPIGTFGSHNTAAPSTFGFSGTASRNIIGMDTNVANSGGLVVGSNTGDFDYFMPGSPYVSWGCGYQIGSTNYAANAINNSGGYTAGTGLVAGGVTDTTPSGSTTDTSAEALATFNNNLQVTQDIHLGVSDKFFTILVTLKNVGSTTLNHVRYTWNVDPDNTVDIGGSYTTVNNIVNTSAQDGYSVVQAASTGGTTSANIFLIAPDPRAKGFVNIGFGGGYQLYNSALYDTNTYVDGNSFTSDTGIGQTWDVGTLTAGQSTQFTLYISLSNMSVSSVLATIPPTISAGTIDPTSGAVSITPVFYSGTGTITDGSGTVLVASAVSGHTYSFTPTTTTVYNVNVTSGGVTTISSTTVTISAPPPPPAPVASGLNASPTIITAGGTITLTPNFSNGTGAIDNGVGVVVSGNSYTVTPTTNTLYTLTVTSSNNATATTNNSVAVYPVPTAALTSSGTSFTIGSLIALTPNYSGGTAVITPNVGSVTSNAIVYVAPTATTNYTLSVTNPAGTTTNNSITLTRVAQAGTITLSNTTQAYTGNAINPAVTTTPNGLSYSLTYYPGGSTAPTLPGTYAVTASITEPYYYGTTGGSLVIGQASQAITLPSAPTPTVNVPVTLNATSPSGGTITYTLVSGNATLNSGVLTLTDTNPVVVQATQNGTSNYTANTQNFTFNGLAYPTANALATGNINLTLGQSVSFTPNFAGGTGAITPNIGAVVSGNSYSDTPTANTAYTLTVTNSSGVAITQNAQVNVYAAATTDNVALTTNAITLGQTVSFTANYAGGIVSITPNTGAVITTNNGVATVTLTPNATTTYNYTVTNPAGTAITQPLTLNVYAAPTANALATGNINLTLGQSVSFTPNFANGTAVITPNIGAVVSGNSYSDTPSASTLYSLVITNPAGTVITKNAQVNVYAAPTTPGSNVITATSIAAGSSITVTPVFTGGTATLTGVTGNVVSGQTYTIYPTTSGNVVLTVTNPVGAVTTQTLETVTIVPNPTISNLAIAPATLPYGGGTITLTPTFANGTGVITPNIGTVVSGTAYTVNVTANKTYTLTVTNSTGAAVSTTNSVVVSGVTTRLVNISALGSITPTSTYTVGFVVKGTAPKSVLVRGVGPALGAFNVATPLATPTLTVYDVNTNVLGINSGWNSSLASTFASVGAFALPAGSKDAALSAAFNPGNYTAIVTGNTSGNTLVEIYDASASDPTSRIVNLSARGNLAAGNTLTAGFIIQGNTTETVLIRAVGPSLVNYGVTNVLSTPKLSVYNSAGTVIATNTGWTNNVTVSATAALGSTAAQVGAFPLMGGSTDSAVLVTLQPGAYTATVIGLNGNAGNVLLEVYEVSAP